MNKLKFKPVKKLMQYILYGPCPLKWWNHFILIPNIFCNLIFSSMENQVCT